MATPPILIDEVLQVFIQNNNVHIVLGSASGCQNENGQDVKIEAIRFALSSQDFHGFLKSLNEAKRVLYSDCTELDSAKGKSLELASDKMPSGPEKNTVRGDPIVYRFVT
jgi:hypothetical protein